MIREALRHAKVGTTLDLYSHAIGAAKLEAQKEIAVAITSAAVVADWLEAMHVTASGRHSSHSAAARLA